MANTSKKAWAEPIDITISRRERETETTVTTVVRTPDQFERLMTAYIQGKGALDPVAVNLAIESQNPPVVTRSIETMNTPDQVTITQPAQTEKPKRGPGRPKKGETTTAPAATVNPPAPLVNPPAALVNPPAPLVNPPAALVNPPAAIVNPPAPAPAPAQPAPAPAQPAPALTLGQGATSTPNQSFAQRAHGPRQAQSSKPAPAPVKPLKWAEGDEVIVVLKPICRLSSGAYLVAPDGAEPDGAMLELTDAEDPAGRICRTGIVGKCGDNDEYGPWASVKIEGLRKPWDGRFINSTLFHDRLGNILTWDQYAGAIIKS